MKKALKIALIALLVLVLAAAGIAGYLLFFKGRAPESRPDLVRLPDNTPEPPKGYPTVNALYLSYALGWIDILDPAGDIPVPTGVIEKKDVEYGRVGERKLVLDLYTPKDLDKPVPGLIFIHGGGWTKGDKADYKYYTVRFAERGYVVATMGYRFVQEAAFPGCVEDTKCAVRWMRANADELHVDPERIAVIGGSAGAYLAMMAGYSATEPRLEGQGGHAGVSSAVAAVVDLYGPTDLTAPEARDHPTVTSFLKQSYEANPDLYELASPLHHVDAKDPPTLIFQGTLDDLVPVAQSDKLAALLEAVGVPCWYDRLDGFPHTMDVARPVNERVQRLMTAFFDQFLSEKKTAQIPAPTP